MANANLNISAIESFLYSLIYGKVSENVFVGTPPLAIPDSVNEFAVIYCGRNINDLHAYGRGIVLVYLYAKPLSNGGKNVKVLKQMENALTEAVESNHNAIYRTSKRAVFTDYDEKRNLHANIVQVNLTIL